MKPSPGEIFDDFICLIFPRVCAGCQDALVKGEDQVCSRCMLEMPRSNYHLEPENPFYIKLRSRLRVRFVMSLFRFVKSGRVQHVLHSLKYRNNAELGRALGRLYGDELIKAGYYDQFDLIVPIPLHPIKKRRRGYNQSEEFGIGLGEVLALECSERYLKRVVQTDTQTRRSKLRRWENVRDVFSVVTPDAVSEKRILIVDDVVTTGATLEAAGRLLLDAGCKDLSVACIAAAQ